MSEQQIAALYVESDGCYFGLDGADPWDMARDARTYSGPHPVVAHPPCARWSMLAGLVEKLHGHKKGDDGGCFELALASVRKYGGVIEHPANSAAWGRFMLPRPYPGGGWQQGICGGWSTSVEQVHYGHRGRKATWLYAVRCDLPVLVRGPGVAATAVANMSSQERRKTPQPFRDLLIGMARSAGIPS